MFRPFSGRRGFSVVELLIALAILSVVMTAFIYAMMGRRTESVKSAAYFDAVWVAQRLCDDLDHRARENPYALEDLAGPPVEFDLLDPAAPFLRFLEDGNANRRLGDDPPFAAGLSERERAELSRYHVTLTLERGVGNGLARARVAVSWREGGLRHEYALDHLLADQPAAITVDEGRLERPVATDDYLVAAFFDQPGRLDDLLREFSVDRGTLALLAEIQQVSRAVANELAALDRRIADRRADADAWSAEGLAAVADLHERAALAILKGYATLAPSFARARAMLAEGGPAFGRLFMNRRARAVMTDLARLADRTLGRANGSCFAARFNADLASAFNLCARIAGDPAAAASASYRRRAAAGRRAADYAVALAQNGAATLRVELDGRTLSLENHLLATLAALKAAAENRDYNRADYLDRILRAVREKSFRPAEDISTRLANMNAAAGIASALLERVTDLLGSGAIF